MEVLRVSEAKSENRMPGIVEVGVLAISTLANHSSSSSAPAPAPARDTCDQITVGPEISGCKEIIMSTILSIEPDLVDPRDPKYLTDSEFESYTKTLMNNVEKLIERTHSIGEYYSRTARLREREKLYLETLDIIEKMWMVLEKGSIIAFYSNINGDEGAAMNTLATGVEDSLLDKTIRHLVKVRSLGDNGKMKKFKDKLPRTAVLIDQRRTQKPKGSIRPFF